MHDAPKSAHVADAEILALKCLSWLVGNEELLPFFLGSTGASEGDLRDRAGDPVFLGAVLDFVLMDDNWIMAFCEAEGLKGDFVMRARQVLPGGEQTNWT